MPAVEVVLDDVADVELNGAEAEAIDAEDEAGDGDEFMPVELAAASEEVDEDGTGGVSEDEGGGASDSGVWEDEEGVGCEDEEGRFPPDEDPGEEDDTLPAADPSVPGIT